MKKRILNLKEQMTYENVSIFLMFVIIFMVFAFQHFQIGIYFDDYSNASLSYGYTVPHVAGTNYNLGDMMTWASWIYMNWGGRLLYACLLLIPLLKFGAHLYMIIQAFVITLTLFYMYRICLMYTNKKRSVFMLLWLVIGYFFIQREFVVNGLYWASASILYIWPILPFMMFIFYYIRHCHEMKNNEHLKASKGYMVKMIILTMFICLAQEQFTIAFIGFLVTYALIDHFKEKKRYIKSDVILLIIGVICCGITLFAPGNSARMDTNGAFATMNIIEKFTFNMPIILNIMFCNEMMIYNFIMIAFSLLLSIYLLKKNRRYMILTIITALVFVVYIVYWRIGINHETMMLVYKFFFLIDMLVVYGFFFYEQEKLSYISLVISAAGSVFCLLMSPSILHRSLFTYLFILYILMAITFDVLYTIVKENPKSYIRDGLLTISICFMVACGCKSLSTTYVITQGYHQNAFFVNNNDYRLKHYKEYMVNNKVHLYKLPTSYSSVMPYHDGFSHINNWMKEYYNIPKNVKIVWKDFK